MNAFKCRDSRFHFGWKIVDRDYTPRKVLFATTSRKQAEYVYEKILRNEEIDVDPINEPLPKVFIINHRHYTEYNIVKSLEEIDRICFGFLKDELDRDNLDDWNFDYSELTQEYIDACPDKDAQKDLQCKFNNLQNSNKQIKEHNDCVRIAKEKLQANDSTQCHELISLLGYSSEVTEFSNIDYTQN